MYQNVTTIIPDTMFYVSCGSIIELPYLACYLLPLVIFQFNTLRRLLNKTGGGEIPDSKRIGKFEQIALDYVGVEGVVGK